MNISSKYRRKQGYTSFPHTAKLNDPPKMVHRSTKNGKLIRVADVDGNSSNLLLTADTGRYFVFPNNSIPNSTRKVNVPEEIPALKAESSGMNGEVPPVPALENMQATPGGKVSRVRSNTLKQLNDPPKMVHRSTIQIPFRAIV